MRKTRFLSLLVLLMVAVTSAWATTATVTYNGSEVSNPEGFFTHDTSGKFNFNTKFTGEYDGVSYSKGLKMEGTTKILFTTTAESTITIVQSTYSSNTIMLDGTELAVDDAAAGTGCRIYTIENVLAGDHTVTRGSGESGLFMIKAEWEDTSYIYFDNTDSNWAKVNVYAWSGDGDAAVKFAGEWPGVEMTLTETPNLYMWSTTGSPEKIIFNNGDGVQTDGNGFEFVKGATYNKDGRVIIKQDFTLTFKTEKEWTDIYAYAWNDKENNGWPGVKMTETSGVWTATVQLENAPTGVLFHNNNGEQTPDFVYEADKTYEYNQNTYTASFTTDAGWETVNAYIWSGDGDAATNKYLGEWPGTALTAEGGVYTVTFKTYGDAPANIQFNNGDAKTRDMVFTNGRAYKWVTATPLYALTEGATFAAGTKVDVKDGDDVVATITYGVDGGEAFQAAVAAGNDDYAGFNFMTPGNGVNGSADGGTVYTIKPVYDGTITVGVRLNGGKKFHINEDGTDMTGYEGITIANAANTSYSFAVKAGSTYKLWCDGSKLGFFGFDYTGYVLPAPTYYVVGTMNPDWNINTKYQLQANTETEGEYYIHGMALAAGTEFKVVSSTDDGASIQYWYPADENYVVNTTGTYSIYFRPDGQGGADWHYGVIYAQMTGVTLSEEEDNTNVLSQLDGKKIDVTLTRTLKTGGWNTFAVPFAVSSTALTALNGMLSAQGGSLTVKQLDSSELSGETLTLNFKDATEMEAGKPYLVKVSKDVNLATLPAAIAAAGVPVNPFKDALISKEAVAIQTTYADFVPTLGKTTINGSNAKEMLFLGAANTLYNPTALPTNMKGFRAYFLLKGADSARSFVLNLGDETTSIEYSTLNNDRSSEAIFDLQGRKVENATKKGVYIVNGKKVIK